MWQRAGSVCQRCVREVLNRTREVEPTGLYASSRAFMGRSPAKARVIALVIRLHAMSASSWYRSWAG
jgi:hypothetical protein